MLFLNAGLCCANCVCWCCCVCCACSWLLHVLCEMALLLLLLLLCLMYVCCVCCLCCVVLLKCYVCAARAVFFGIDMCVCVAMSLCVFFASCLSVCRRCGRVGCVWLFEPSFGNVDGFADVAVFVLNVRV